MEIGRYRIADPDALVTPALVLFEKVIDHNIRTACELAGGAQNLFVHAKTHKSEAITRKLIEAGIDSFKVADLNELAMIMRAGARRAILAYPQTQAIKIDKLIDLVAGYPDAWIAAIAGSQDHVAMLGRAAARRGQHLPVMLDLDPGMHRTGVEIGDDALDLYRTIDAHASLAAAGLHWYDGHDTFRDPQQREAAAAGHIDTLKAFRQRLESSDLPVRYIVAGGAYSFAYYARTEGFHGSPGSFIYWDARCKGDMPDMPFESAALVLTQVVDRHQARRTITTDLGYKSICSDQPLQERARLLGHEGAHLVLHNEEYGVFQMPGELPDVGAYLLAMPWHIGPTTVRYPGSHVVDCKGKVIGFFAHTARDRMVLS